MTILLRAFVIGAVFRAISVTCLTPQADTLTSTLPGTVRGHIIIRRCLPIISIDADYFSAVRGAFTSISIQAHTRLYDASLRLLISQRHSLHLRDICAATFIPTPRQLELRECHVNNCVNAKYHRATLARHNPARHCIHNKRLCATSLLSKQQRGLGFRLRCSTPCAAPDSRVAARGCRRS